MKSRDEDHIGHAGTQLTAPACPLCNKPMRKRTAKAGAHAGQAFWGCSAYPDCRGIRSMEG